MQSYELILYQRLKGAKKFTSWQFDAKVDSWVCQFDDNLEASAGGDNGILVYKLSDYQIIALTCSRQKQVLNT